MLIKARKCTKPSVPMVAFLYNVKTFTTRPVSEVKLYTYSILTLYYSMHITYTVM